MEQKQPQAEAPIDEGLNADDLGTFLIVLDRLDQSMQATFRRVEARMAEQERQRRKEVSGDATR